MQEAPTPNGADRDEREYVINRHGTTGGIQRFKAGNHGAGHKVGAMIAYIQQETSEFWNTRVAEWVNELIARGEQGWTAKDLLRLDTGRCHSTGSHLEFVSYERKRPSGT
jgi:hypothetical protein